jgi:hypothetical protein
MVTPHTEPPILPLQALKHLLRRSYSDVWRVIFDRKLLDHSVLNDGDEPLATVVPQQSARIKVKPQTLDEFTCRTSARYPFQHETNKRVYQ